MATEIDDLLARFDELGIKHETVRHAAAHTVEEARQMRVDRGEKVEGGHAKNLFLKCKKGGLYLITAHEDTEIKLNQLHKRIGAGRLSFGASELMREVLKVTPGSVTPFALLNDPDQRLSFILDERLMREDPLHFHPLTNTATTTISRTDFLHFLKACGHTPRIMDLRVQFKTPH